MLRRVWAPRLGHSVAHVANVLTCSHCVACVADVHPRDTDTLDFQLHPGCVGPGSFVPIAGKAKLWLKGEKNHNEKPRSDLYIYSQLMSWASLVIQMVKNLPAMQETRVQFLRWEDPLKKGTATHSSILAWRIPWIEEPDLSTIRGVAESDMTE